jgi:hypothetical protein
VSSNSSSSDLQHGGWHFFTTHIDGTSMVESPGTADTNPETKLLNPETKLLLCSVQELSVLIFFYYSRRQDH